MEVGVGAAVVDDAVGEGETVDSGGVGAADGVTVGMEVETPTITVGAGWGQASHRMPPAATTQARAIPSTTAPMSNARDDTAHPFLSAEIADYALVEIGPRMEANIMMALLAPKRGGGAPSKQAGAPAGGQA